VESHSKQTTFIVEFPIIPLRESNEAERLIREQEQFLRNIYEGVEHLICVVDVTEEGKFIEVAFNPAADRATGLVNSQITGKSSIEVFRNAIDAINEKNISSKETSNEFEPEISICTELVASERVIIRFIDNGTGVSEKVAKRLYDPFFTTKPVGKRT